MTHALAYQALMVEEGALFVATNPTVGTAIATSTSVQQSFSATVPHFVIRNSAPTAGRNVYLQSIRLVQIGGTAPASNTSVQCAVLLDTGERTPTAGAVTSPIVPAACNGSGPASVSRIWTPSGANVTAPAAVNARTVARLQLKGGATTLLDEYEILFGAVAPSTATAFSAAGRFSVRAPMFVIPPQGFALIYLWFPAGVTNAFTHEYEIVLVER